jgi:hypothetical protein
VAVFEFFAYSIVPLNSYNGKLVSYSTITEHNNGEGRVNYSLLGGGSPSYNFTDPYPRAPETFDPLYGVVDKKTTFSGQGLAEVESQKSIYSPGFPQFSDSYVRVHPFVFAGTACQFSFYAVNYNNTTFGIYSAYALKKEEVYVKDNVSTKNHLHIQR